jgi:hypothetical protein
MGSCPMIMQGRSVGITPESDWGCGEHDAWYIADELVVNKRFLKVLQRCFAGLCQRSGLLPVGKKYMKEW